MSMGEKTAFVKQGRAEENKFSWPQCFSQIYLTSTAQHLWTPSFPPLQLAPNMPGYFVLFGPMRQTRCTVDINTSTWIMHVKSSVTESYIGCGQTAQGLWDPAEQMWCSSCRTQWLNQGSVWYFFYILTVIYNILCSWKSGELNTEGSFPTFSIQYLNTVMTTHRCYSICVVIFSFIGYCSLIHITQSCPNNTYT